MRIENLSAVEHLGSVRIHDVRRLLELDSGSSRSAVVGAGQAQIIEHEAIEAIEKKMAIVIPVKDEELKVFEGVLSGIPHNCQIIVVSNSQRSGIDYFKSELDILERFCQSTGRRAIIVHQRDPFLARAVECSGYSELLDDDGYIRSGKSEGMLVGLLLCAMLEKEYVGFIDADNFVPGAVWEYVKHYAIGFVLAQSPLSMVRILWHYKPKMIGELYFKKWGRVSEVTNRYMNHFISTKGRFETGVVKTSNAGEHAMSLNLAMRLPYATGYAVETQELISVLEQFGGAVPVADNLVTQNGVDIIQTETINPHLHEERNDNEHLFQGMLVPSLAVIYHSQLCEDSTRKLILNQLVESECIAQDQEVPHVHLLPPPQKADIKLFAEALETQFGDIALPGGWLLGEKPSRYKQPGNAQKVLFSDIDGTILHPQSYTYAPALQGIRNLQERRIPLVLCSAKTLAEQEALRRELDIKDPFIVESGGAIYIPKDYFRFPFSFNKTQDEYQVIELGAPFAEIKQRLQLVAQSCSVPFSTFGNMDVDELAQRTGLTLQQARLARERCYSETLIVDEQINGRLMKSLQDAMMKEGLHSVFGGRFFEVGLGSDKGKAVKILCELFKLNFNSISTFAIGNGLNDVSMLQVCDHPMLVQEIDKRWTKVKVKDLVRIKDVGPQGFSRAVEEEIIKFEAVAGINT
ncbi:MAG: bifunctional mannosyl-3-phosphoglycerate synthase/mannosyl-3 phosphoglycerate phosphatase [Dehalococcoidia bacterium]|nr:bifunctional mannosyl-3-phosphoglycerate synthase/mannosyl-3 phosphoglycerate phosphatase [Dehalococcoidia bacterium]